MFGLIFWFINYIVMILIIVVEVRFWCDASVMILIVASELWFWFDFLGYDFDTTDAHHWRVAGRRRKVSWWARSGLCKRDHTSSRLLHEQPTRGWVCERRPNSTRVLLFPDIIYFFNSSNFLTGFLFWNSRKSRLRLLLCLCLCQVIGFLESAVTALVAPRVVLKTNWSVF